MHRLGVPVLASLFLAGLGAVVACGSTPPPDSEDFGNNNTGSGGATGAATTDTSTGAIMDGPSGTGSGAGGMEACAQSQAKAEPVKVNLFIMLDKSGSMGENNKWTNVSQALDAFFQDPATAGLRVALRMFPDSGCDENSCNTQACATPLVDIGDLTKDPAPMDVQEQKLVQAVGSRSPGGGTPMSAALAGAEVWAMNYAAGHMGEKVGVLLATDGEPNGCDNNVGDIAALAKNANSTAGVLTYAIGFQGSNPATLDQIAAAGGTMKSFLIGNGNAEQDLLNTLKAIQGSVVSCQFAMPASMNGMPIDPMKVNVSYQPGNGGMKEDLGEVKSAADCTAQGGWYYDDPNNPTTITLCPSTCMEVQADPMAELNLVFGCQSKMIN